MCKNFDACETEFFIGELRQQLEYAKVVSDELFNMFSYKSEACRLQEHEYPVIETKLSMLLDFIFQAGLWCNVLENRAEKEEEK